ncbi:uncharacterized protein BT62DRAFT_918235 [Guyanagaster necrorhizus]|uniref:Uncharacterized protein n=1 Tax=Guyanagaster necrorhizus TaxID=856835 RepID=A0A9P8AUN9_9AGAR|nr:uncharacterized protein BT62DRAFT_918235 [Guyanagaster necrorhizus MCA 3950]KAG7448668.1 hypothetical protein BT62DRAFT_918235 [Guyanagaster necrorhizus MCA 3950]
MDQGDIHGLVLLPNAEGYEALEIIPTPKFSSPYPFTPISETIATTLVHNFMAFRLYRLTEKLYFFGFGITMGVKAWIIGSPVTNLYGMFAMPCGCIYTNTLMDTLMPRKKLKETLTSEPIDVTSTVIIRMVKGRQRSHNSVPNQIPVVNVQRGIYSGMGATEMNRLDSTNRKHQPFDDHEDENMWASGLKL